MAKISKKEKKVTYLTINLFYLYGEIWAIKRMIILQISQEIILNELELALYYTDQALGELEITKEEYEKILEYLDRIENIVRSSQRLALGIILGDFEVYLKRRIKERENYLIKQRPMLQRKE